MMDAATERRRTVDLLAAKLTLGIWAFTFLLFLAPQYAATGHVPPFLAGAMAVEILAGMGLSVLLYVVARRMREAGSWAKILVVGAGICVAALAFSLFDAWFGGLILKLFMSAHRVPEDVVNMTVSNFISFSWLYGMLGSVYVILQTNAVMRERDLQLAEARSLVQTAQLTALRLQLNPHFLFNTLNAISSLIVTGRNKQGEAMLGKLCDFLRTALTADAQGSIPLGEELETLQNYLEIEAIRFGDRLTVEFDCPEELLELAVPSFILQPLVENAVKYAVAPTSRPVIVRVAAQRRGKHLLLTVDDNGGQSAFLKSDGGTGVGLENVRRRLEVLYGDAARLETMAHSDGFLAMIRLPMPNERNLELVA
jgi:hypothetical protein